VKKKNQTRKDKHPYEAPQLRVIELAMEEVLGIGCFSTSSQVYVSMCKTPGTCKV
jgi:hypothetical protein